MKLTRINTDITQLWFSKKLFDEKRLIINIEMRSAGIAVCAYVSCSPRPAPRGSMASILHSPETTTSYPPVGRVEANPWLGYCWWPNLMIFVVIFIGFSVFHHSRSREI